MLIKALCDYYDSLAQSGEALPDGYSNVNVHYLISLSPDGEITNIIDYQKKVTMTDNKGKEKVTSVPREEIMPLRTEKPGVDGNIIEHRPLYIFGLNYDKGEFTTDDETDKAKKSHAAFVEKNLRFIEGLDSPLINAYRSFLLNWIPENETQNKLLLSLDKAYSKSSYAFCLDGFPEVLLNREEAVKQKWEDEYSFNKENEQDQVTAQCAVIGDTEPIARTHSKIKGLRGGLTTGGVLVGCNNTSENSYGNEQSYNSNVSVTAMKKYTYALNRLLSDKRHRTTLDDFTVVFWASGGEDKNGCSDFLSAMLFGENDLLNEEQTNDILLSLMKSARDGNITFERIGGLDKINPNVDFYMVGLKPNSSRIAVKFIYRKRFGEILVNIAQHQNDMQIYEKMKPVPLWRLKSELISPNSSDKNVDPSLITKIFESVIYGTKYPDYLLSTLVRRVQTDKYVNEIRAGALKACINRQSRSLNQKEEITLALDYNNTNQAYLCGRLFASLEKLQLEASGKLNRTIKDAYFASASSKPAMVFPKLMTLAQTHLKKVNRDVYFNKLIQEIIDKLDGEFPETLPLTEQGKFIIGYYQQFNSFFIKNSTDDNSKEEK